MYRARKLHNLLLLLLVLAVLGCSTQKNTSGSRFYHSATARFNTLYNGQVAFEEGVAAQQQGHVDNYTELLPMHIVSASRTAALGKSNFDTAIEKCEKAIKRHSISKKPKKPQGRMTDKQKAYYARKEFNPYLRHAWLLFADAQFHKGDFIEAASTYNYILRLYSTQPDVASVARARLALCYVMLDWPYDAEDVLTKTSRDSLTLRGRRELEATQAAYLISTKQYAQAIEPLRNTARRAKGRQQKARLYYLLGQLSQQAGNTQEAYRALRKCVRLNPPYELAFNARIMQTEVMAAGQGRTMIRRLKRMAHNPNNANYLDRIYYAIGNIYLAEADTMQTIYAWRKGIEESTQGGFAKAVVLRRLGELHWEREEYIEATDCYNQLASLLTKEDDLYEQAQWRSRVLTELEPHLSAVKLQDSLQALALLPESEYLAAIDRVIDDLKRKEREAERRAEAQGLTAAATAQAAAVAKPAAQGAAGAQRGQQQTQFYFYNAQTVLQGKQTFQRQWGNRPNEDNWRRSSKAQQDDDAAFEGYDYAAEDSLMLSDDTADGTLDDEQQRIADSLANDPHHREYYLAQIPFTDEQVAASNELIRDGLYHGGTLLMERVGNYALAERTLSRLLTRFPDFDKRDDVHYHLFLLALRRGDEAAMDEHLSILRDSFPESKLTQTVTHPRFLEYATRGRHIEDSLYAEAYMAYQRADYKEVQRLSHVSATDFPEGSHRGKMLFVTAMSSLYGGERDSFLVQMREVAQRYSKDEIAELAAAIVKGLEDGRLLASEQWDASSIWSRRSVALTTDSTQADTLVADVLVPYVFVLAYPTGEVDEDQLLFEMARYNFTSFVARRFDIELTQSGTISQLRVTGFATYDEVHAYAQQLYSDPHMRARLEGMRAILISEANLRLLGTRYSYDDYAEFYDLQLSRRALPDDALPDEPDLVPIDPDDIIDGEEPTSEPSSDDQPALPADDDDWLW